MVWIKTIFNKIRFLFIAVVDALKYVCCRRNQRRKLSHDFAPLSSIGVVSTSDNLVISSDGDVWGENMYRSNNRVEDNPAHSKSVQECISQYRQQKYSQITSTSEAEPQPDFFQDMEPTIVRQKKLIIKQQSESYEPQPMNSRLSFSPATALQKGGELSSWEEMESTGNWDLEEQSTDQILREKRRLEREKRMAENMKKRMEKEKNRIASKIS